MELHIGEKLKEIRMMRGLTLEETAVLTEVSKPMLGQIERGQSVPTITTLWKIATGLKAPLSSLLEEGRGEYAVTAPDRGHAILGDGGRMRAYPLFLFDPVRSVETFCIEFDPGCRHASPKHSDGVEEHVFVLQGTLQMVLGEERVTVKERQAIRFRADISHVYENVSSEICEVYNMIFYGTHLGG